MPGIKEFLPNKRNAKFWLIGGAAATGLFIYERRKTAGDITVADATTAASTDSAGYDSSQYDLSSDYGGYSNTPIGGGYYNPNGYGYSGDYSGTAVAAAPTTDAQWAVDSESTLGNLGYDQTAGALAISKYLLKQKLTQDQANMVSVALANVGAPPQSGNLPIQIIPSTGQNPSTPVPPKVANGYYRDIVHGWIWEVQSETRHMVTPASWKKIYESQHPKVTPIISTSNVYKLHRGADI